VDLDLVFLGTSGSMPTAQRAPTALLLRRGGERLLFDCAEGTQRQLLKSNVGLVELREVFLTHYHADHYLGLPGMLKTFALRGRELPLTIHGPAGLRELYGGLRRAFGRLSYEVDLVELAAAVETPFYCYSTATLRRHYEVFASAFAMALPMPREAPVTRETFPVKRGLSFIDPPPEPSPGQPPPARARTDPGRSGPSRPSRSS